MLKLTRSESITSSSIYVMTVIATLGRRSGIRTSPERISGYL